MKICAIIVGLLIAACCLLNPQQINATPNTYTYSTIDFDDSTGTVLATGHTQADYQTGAYYQTTGAGLSLKDSNGNQVASQQKQAYGVTVDVSAQTDGYADEQYEVDTGHYILATYYLYNYYYQGQYRNGYDDQYNYTAVEGQNWGTYDSYTFYGNGPIVVSQYTNDIILGQSKKTVKVGTPDHLKLVSDNIVTLPNSGGSCGQVQRSIRWRVVDQAGRGTGKTAVGESFPGQVVNQCTGNEPSPTPCSYFVGGQVHPNYTDGSGKFSADDLLSIGCPAPDNTCGFTIDPDTWVWCKAPDFTSNRVPLAAIVYDIRKSGVSVGGRATQWNSNTEFFADGTIRTP
ncbi:MAG: hypothetical protein QOH41_1260 [Blastocatellia bacterium]|jgi:hypothetical protein|nr:hypothetical protein [Blastocatellia bacterium]